MTQVGRPAVGPVCEHVQVYSEHPLPHGAALWRSVDSAAGVIAADGCVDLILRDERVLVAGPSTRWIATLADDEHGSLGFRLPPGTAGPLLRTPLGDLADRLVPLEDVVSVSRARHLRQQMIGTAAAADAVVRRTAAFAPALDDDAWIARACEAARVTGSPRTGSPPMSISPSARCADACARRSATGMRRSCASNEPPERRGCCAGDHRRPRRPRSRDTPISLICRASSAGWSECRRLSSRRAWRRSRSRCRRGRARWRTAAPTARRTARCALDSPPR